MVASPTTVPIDGRFNSTLAGRPTTRMVQADQLGAHQRLLPRPGLRRLLGNLPTIPAPWKPSIRCAREGGAL